MIPLSRPVLGAEEVSAIAAVLATGRLVQGEQVVAFERAVSERVGRKYAVAVANGTAALRLALETLGIRAGDRVLVPDLTWPSPAHAVIELGAEPVLVDVDEREWNVSPRSLSRTNSSALQGLRAAIVIDQFGYPARVRELAQSLPGVPLLVDAACSLGSHTGREACGALGVIACHSFHPRKLLTTGEGGMCLTDDANLAGRLAELRNHGQRAPGDFARASGNHRLSELAAALGLVQLGRLSGMVEERARLAARYASALDAHGVQQLAPGSRPNYQTFGFLLPPRFERDAVLAALRARGVEAGRLSYALHALPQLAAYARGEAFEHATALATRGIALPLWPGLRDAEQDLVIDALRAVLREGA